MAINFEGQITPADWGKANALHFKPSLISTLGRLYVLAMVTMSTCAVIYVVVFMAGESLGDILPSMLIMVPFYALVGLGIAHPFWVGYWARIQYKMNKTSFPPIRGQVSDDGVVVRAPNAVSEIKWALYKKVKETKELLLLYQNKNCFNYFPRSFFASEADWQAFKELVKSKLPPK